MLRLLFKRAYLNAISHRVVQLSKRQIESSAVIFSPHYDDETLGVGGTIIKKRKSGAEVYIVFMTDGSKSHQHAMDGTRLSALRRKEALNASKVLGIDESHIRFLDYPETNLHQHIDEAVYRVAGLLSDMRCEQVFVPATIEPMLWSLDHNATTDIVFRALSIGKQTPEILEYGVWFWYHWPWVSILHNNDARRLLRLSRRALFGLSAITHFSTAICITDVLVEKRSALEKYNSQMKRLVQDKPWPVLGDIGNGEFLKQFFGSYEFFSCCNYPAMLNSHVRGRVS